MSHENLEFHPPKARVKTSVPKNATTQNLSRLIGLQIMAVLIATTPPAFADPPSQPPTLTKTSTPKPQYEKRQEYSPEEVLAILADLSEHYGIPFWFLAAMAHCESTLNSYLVNSTDRYNDGKEWDAPNPACSFYSDDPHPRGGGLYQLTGWMYQGSPYPFCIESPQASDPQKEKAYYWAMKMQKLGRWIDLKSISPITN